MLNQIVLVGRLVSDLEIKETENGKKVCNITLAVNRTFKNENGEYDTDIIPCTLFDGVAENTCEYCHKGDVIGVKGRMICKEDKLEIIAEKVTFLASRKKEEV